MGFHCSYCVYVFHLLFYLDLLLLSCCCNGFTCFNVFNKFRFGFNIVSCFGFGFNLFCCFISFCNGFHCFNNFDLFHTCCIDFVSFYC